MSEKTVDKIRQKVVNSPKKSIRTSFETQIPATTVWRVIQKRLQIRPYKLQLNWYGLFWTVHNFLANFIYRFFIDFRPDPFTLHKQPCSLNF